MKNHFLENTKTIHNTKIFPLRWFANFCNHLGTPHIVKMFYMQEELGVTNGIKWKYHSFMWNWTYAVYKKWGTYYTLILDELKNDPILDKLGSDYDENGIPYWEKWEDK